MSTRTLPTGIYESTPGRFSARVKAGGREHHGGTHGSLEEAIAARDAIRDKAGAAAVAFVAVTRTSGVKFLDVDTFDLDGPVLAELPFHDFGVVKFKNELGRGRAW